MIRKIVAYTDGSANAQNRLGGYGIYIIDGGREYFYHEGMSHTTTGRMELRAAIICLTKITNKDAFVEIHADSMYVVNCVSQDWLKIWKRNGWVSKKNTDLLQIFYDELFKFKYPPKLFHVKGHTKNEDEHSLGNAIVDELADYKQFKEYRKDKGNL